MLLNFTQALCQSFIWKCLLQFPPSSPLISPWNESKSYRVLAFIFYSLLNVKEPNAFANILMSDAQIMYSSFRNTIQKNIDIQMETNAKISAENLNKIVWHKHTTLKPAYIVTAREWFFFFGGGGVSLQTFSIYQTTWILDLRNCKGFVLKTVLRSVWVPLKTGITVLNYTPLQNVYAWRDFDCSI
jgi:hypothetical protein